jgi:hypothetical protein
LGIALLYVALVEREQVLSALIAPAAVIDASAGES